MSYFLACALLLCSHIDRWTCLTRKEPSVTVYWKKSENRSLRKSDQESSLVEVTAKILLLLKRTEKHSGTTITYMFTNLVFIIDFLKVFRDRRQKLVLTLHSFERIKVGLSPPKKNFYLLQ